MEGARFAYGFALGMLTVVNPCGFALLPAYLTYYLGLTDEPPTGAMAHRPPALRALQVSGAMTLGFLVVFTPIGLLWQGLASAAGSALPWVTIVIGIAVFAVGVAMLAGSHPTIPLPKLAVGKGRPETWSMFVFGISYAVASLSCALPLFVATMSTTFDTSFGAGLGTLVAYGLGMGVLLAAMTMAVALAKEGLVRKMRAAMPHLVRVSGALLVLAGAVVAYTGWAELQTFGNRQGGTGLYDRLLSWQSSISNWIQTQGVGRVALACLLVVAGGIALSAALRRGRNGEQSNAHLTADPAEVAPPSASE